MIKSSRTIKILSLLVVLFVFIAIFVSIAEVIELTTILPSQDVLRVRRGAIGDGPDVSPSDGIPDWEYTTVIIPSNSLIVGGSVGIGTTSPAYKLDVVSQGNAIRGVAGTGNTFGVHGVGGEFSVYGSGGVYGVVGQGANAGVFGLSTNDYIGVLGRDTGTGVGVQGHNTTGFGWAGRFIGNVRVEGSSASSSLVVDGHAVPAFINFNICSLGTPTNRWTAVHADDIYGVTHGFIGCHEFPIQQNTHFETGDAIIVENGKLQKSYKPRDPRSIGIYVKTMNGEYLIAGAGDNRNKKDIQGFKICDEGGPVREGDLLTTSSTPGYLMRQVDENGNYDNIIRDYTVGKSMENIEFDSDGKAQDIYGFIYTG